MDATRFTSIDYRRIEGRGDRAVVLCDRDRPEGMAVLVGQTVGIDGEPYLVIRVEGGGAGVRKGERVALWVERGEFLAAKAGR